MGKSKMVSSCYAVPELDHCQLVNLEEGYVVFTDDNGTECYISGVDQLQSTIQFLKVALAALKE